MTTSQETDQRRLHSVATGAIVWTLADMIVSPALVDLAIPLVVIPIAYVISVALEHAVETLTTRRHRG